MVLVCKGAEAVAEGLATFEFLRDANGDFPRSQPRVQVEHTVRTHHRRNLELGIVSHKAKPTDEAGRHHRRAIPFSAGSTPRSVNLCPARPPLGVPFPERVWHPLRHTHAHPGHEMPGCFDSLLAKLLRGAGTERMPFGA